MSDAYLEACAFACVWAASLEAAISPAALALREDAPSSVPALYVGVGGDAAPLGSGVAAADPLPAGGLESSESTRA